jgi:hypothetical protein
MPHRSIARSTQPRDIDSRAATSVTLYICSIILVRLIRYCDIFGVALFVDLAKDIR